MTVLNISNHGRITIPAELRSKYGWKDGDKVLIVDHPLDGIKILPYLSDDQMRGILDEDTGMNIIKKISKERKAEIETEKARLYDKASSRSST